MVSIGLLLYEGWTNFTPVLYKLYPKLWGNDEPLNFFIFVWTNYCELKHFLEMVLWKVAPVCWHITFISRSWGVRARFVIFGCSLPHLTIHLFFLLIFLLSFFGKPKDMCLCCVTGISLPCYYCDFFSPSIVEYN